MAESKDRYNTGGRITVINFKCACFLLSKYKPVLIIALEMFSHEERIRDLPQN